MFDTIIKKNSKSETNVNTTYLSPEGRQYLDQSIRYLKCEDAGAVKTIRISEQPSMEERESIDLAMECIYVLSHENLSQVSVKIFSSNHRPRINNLYGRCASNVINRDLFYKAVVNAGYSIRPLKPKSDTSRGTMYSYIVSRKGFQ